MLQHLGRLEESCEFYRRAILIDGSVPEAYNNFGSSLLALGRLAEAASTLESGLQLRPDYAIGLDTLGLVRSEQGRASEALEHFERSLQIDPSAAPTYVHRGQTLLKLQRYGDAQSAFEAALERQPDAPAALDGLGVARHKLGRPDAAIGLFRRALACNPRYENAACNLAKVLVEVGHLEEAMSWLERALEINPRNGNLYLPLVNFSRTPLGPESLRDLVDLAEHDASLPYQQRVEVNFALGHSYEREGRFDEAFRHFARGNALKRADLHYDETSALGFLSASRNAFGSPLFADLRAYGNPSDRPIFIVGMPRSGTTLVEQVLAAHPEVAGGGELSIFGPVLKEMWPAIEAKTIEEFGAGIRRIGERYLRETAALLPPAQRITDKTLENFQVVPLIGAALPRARVVHVSRDWLDTCFSCFATLFGDVQVPFSYDLGELGRYYAAYLRVMEVWHSVLPPESILEVQYETLVDHFEAETRRIVAFCGLPWDAACLDFTRADRQVRTASSFQVRQPLFRSSLGRAQPFLRHLQPLIDGARAASDGVSSGVPS